MSVEKLRLLASRVPDAYPDFIMALPLFSKDSGFVDEMIAFIEKNPNANTGKVLEHLDMLEGYPEPLQVEDT